MKKIVLVLALVMMVVQVNPVFAFMVNKDSHVVYRVTMAGSTTVVAAYVPFSYETELLPGVIVTAIGGFDPRWGAPAGAIAVTTGRLENYIRPAYQQPQYYQQPVYQSQPQYYQPQPQPYYQPVPQPQYYPQQPPTVVYQPPQYSSPYGSYIEGVFVGAIGNIIESAGVGAGDRVYDEIARGGRRYRGYYRGGHYRR